MHGTFASCRLAALIWALGMTAALLVLDPAIPAAAETAASPAGPRKRGPSKFAMEMRDARARLRLRLTEIEARQTRAADQPTQAVLAAEIESAKAEAEAEMLDIQARRARAAGHAGAAARLEAAAASLRAGLQHRTSADRGARQAGTGRAAAR